MNNDILANALSKIFNYEKIGKKECTIYPSSKIIKQVLDIMKDNKYIGGYKEIKDGKGDTLIVNLIGNINSCNVVKPRYSVSVDNFTKFEKRFLPSTAFGILIVSTPKGLMIHTEAKKINSGGRLIAYCY